MLLSTGCRSGALILIFVFGQLAFAQREPEESLKTLQVPEGWDISLFASEPMITNPSAIDIDTHGRVWVAEIQWYRSKAKNPPADSIKVLEDTDGDGRADKATVFAEGIFAPMSVCVAGDKVYVATSPDLWVYEDKNGDLKADGPPRKLLTGFGGHNHDHGAHSLVLGPDHKWWMSHGDTGFNVTGTDGSRIEYRWGAMLRGELDGSKLQQYAVNFRNPYELGVSSFGESFCSDNDNDGNFSVRICWILEGGNYGWFGRPPFKKEELATLAPPGTPFREHWHFRGYQPGYVPATLVTGFGSPCGMCFYEGDAFGPRYKNAPLHADAGPREVRIYRHTPTGYGMQATSENLVTTAGDSYFRPDDICAAPDGSLYISDWYDGGVGGHAYNDPDRGRIFRLRPAGKKLLRTGKPGPYATIPDAIEGLKSPNLATQFLAREKLLAEGQTSIPALISLLAHDEPNYRARALWLLDRIGGEARQEVVRQLKSPNAEFRSLAVRILRRHGDEQGSAVLAMADDPSPLVRREVLLAMPKLQTVDPLPVLAKLAAQYDGRDRYQLEAIHIAAGDRKAELYAKLSTAQRWSIQQLPLMQLLDPKAAAELVTAELAKSGLDAASAATLLAAAGSTPSPEAGRGLLQLAGTSSASPELRRLALERLAANLQGNWKPLAGDAQLVSTFQALLSEPPMQSAVLAVIGEQGINHLAADVRALASSASADPAIRAQAVTVSARLNAKELGPALRKLLSDAQPAVRKAALAALVDLQDMATLREVLASGGKFPADVQRETADRLMSSTGGALALLRMIDDKRLAPEMVKAVVAKATSHPDSNVRVLYERFIPEDQRPKRLGSVIKAEEILALKADAARGEKIFFQSSAAQCKNCHVVEGVGTALGPDLSQIGKKYERAALLETILDPSKAIAPEYAAYIMETAAGQVYAGFLVEKSEQQVVLRDAKNQLVRVPASEVAALEPQQKSLMPELVLRDVTAQDAADLLAYLSSLTSATQPVSRFRVLGPFKSFDGQGLDRDFGLEQDLAEIDLTAEFRGVRNQTIRWEEVAAQQQNGFLAVDQVKYCRERNLPGENVTFYYLTFADSAADQQVQLLLGSDDSCKVWVNGRQVHRFQGSRAVGYAQDRVNASFKTGRNTIVLKVENYNGPGGVSLAVSSPAAVQLQTQ
jgi:putative membrane-bound dehydrogenase-like protein